MFKALLRWDGHLGAILPAEEFDRRLAARGGLASYRTQHPASLVAIIRIHPKATQPAVLAGN
jgi:hypothetical protein